MAVQGLVNLCRAPLFKAWQNQVRLGSATQGFFFIMGDIKDSWIAYRKNAIPKDASEDFIKQEKQTFYAGAVAVQAVFNKLDNDMDEITEDDLLKLRNVEKEINEFLRVALSSKITH